MLSGLTTAALLASAATLLGPRNLVAFTALASLATASSTFTCAATGSLMATLVPEPQRGGAGGWYMVGTLAGAALTSGITMSVYERFGTASAALVLAGLAGLPSLGSLVLRESELVTVGVLQTARSMRADILSAFKSRRLLIAMLCLVAPVGPAAAINLFAAIGAEYHVGSGTVILLTGFAGSLLAAGGYLLGGAIADRMNRWRAYLSTGLVIGVFAPIVLSHHEVNSFSKTAVPVYSILSGMANATYTALLLEVIGSRSRAAGSLYAWLNNLGNLPLAYMTWLDGQGHRIWGTPGLFAVDGLGNIVPIVVLFWIVARIRVDAAPGQPDACAEAAVL